MDGLDESKATLAEYIQAVSKLAASESPRLNAGKTKAIIFGVRKNISRIAQDVFSTSLWRQVWDLVKSKTKVDQTS